MATISIIVPVFNLEREISRCLDSILAQTYKDIEIIAVDDGSTDCTHEILQEYAKRDNRIITIHQKNNGVTSARLTGVKVASGQWIGFVDGDDYIEPNMYEILLDNASKYSADISHCGYQMNFENGRTKYFYNTLKFIEQDNTKGLRDLLEGLFVEPGLCNKIYSSKILKDTFHDNEMNTSIKINEDLLMNFFLFKKSHKSVFYDFCPYHYSKPESKAAILNRTLTKNIIFDPIQVRRIILDNADETIKKIAFKSYVNICLTTCNTIVLNGISTYKKELHTVLKLLEEQKSSLDIIGKKRKYMAYFLLKSPYIYGFFYKLYAKFFQK